MLNKETFVFKLLRTFISAYAGILALIALIVSFIFWRYKANSTISLFSFVVVCSVLIFLVIIFLRFSIQIYSESVNQKVKVLQYIEPYKPYKDYEAILLTTNSNTFAQDGLVTLFQEKNGCEVFIATGQIINIQQNGKVQIVIPKSSDSDFNWENIKRNEKDQLDKLIIKTIVTTRLLGGN